MKNIHTYCLFCETQKCKAIACIIEHKYGIRSISPVIIQRKWTKGICEEKRHSWLPGYIFLYSDEPLKNPIYVSGIIRRLGDDELQGTDLAFANMLYEHEGVMGTIHLVEVDQYCTVEDPLWQKMKGKVIKIDRGRKRCCVEFTFDSINRTVWLGYELIQPLKDTDKSKREQGKHTKRK